MKCYDNHLGKPVCNLINQLYDSGFYQILHLYVRKLDNANIICANSLMNLEKLCVGRFENVSETLPVGLKELAILSNVWKMSGRRVKNFKQITKYMEILANNLTNLQRLYVTDVKFSVIMPFIRKSTNLMEIFVESNINETIKLQALNKIRKQSFCPRKLMIYVRDIIFLNTKWSTYQGETSLDLVEVRRAYSYEWDHHFDVSEE